MSLIRIAARMAMVEALKDRTLVGGNVTDSQFTSLDISADGSLRTDQNKQFISVYTEASSTKDVDGRLRAMNRNGPTEFVCEAGIAAAHMLRDEATGVSEVFPGVPETDQAFEFYLDLVMRQISDALNDPDNEWAEIFRKFCFSVISIERMRTNSDGTGTRLAAHQMKITVDLTADPLTGATLKPEHPLAMFFAYADVMFGDPSVNPLATQVGMMKAALNGDGKAVTLALRRYGLTRSEGDAMLLNQMGGEAATIGDISVEIAPAEAP